MRPLIQRHHLVARMRASLERQGFPRLQMMLLVSLTGAVGFLASYTLLGMGLWQMWLRYLLAFGFAYLAFLGLLWLWLRTRGEDYCDVSDVSDAFTPRGGHDCASFQGGGGSGGGGGASGSFDTPSLQPASVDMADDGVSDALGVVGDAASGADELALPLMVILFVAALLLSSLWVVYSAPLLFAELLKTVLRNPDFFWECHEILLLGQQKKECLYRRVPIRYSIGIDCPDTHSLSGLSMQRCST